MPGSRKIRLDRLIDEIRYDLLFCRRIINHPNANGRDYKYITRQIDKFLKPDKVPGISKKNRLTIDLDKLINFFGPNCPANWSFKGFENLREQGLKIFLANGHSPIRGHVGDTIRIAPKAFLFSDTILAGIMLHEATHFVLETSDHRYDNVFFPGHGHLKSLFESRCYENADSWRIFYQKIRVHRRNY